MVYSFRSTLALAGLLTGLGLPLQADDLAIRGVVLAADGMPMPDTRAELRAVTSTYQQGFDQLEGFVAPPAVEATADASGQYLLTAPGAGVFVVRLSAPGKLPRLSVPVALTEAIDLPPVLLDDDVSAALTVRYRDGRPAAGIRVVARPEVKTPRQGGFQVAPRIGETVADGTLSVPRAEGESLVLHLFSPSGAEQVRRGFTGGEVVLAAEPRRRIVLQVTDPDGRPRPEILVRRGEAPWPVGLTDPTGRLELPDDGSRSLHLTLSDAQGWSRSLRWSTSRPASMAVVLPDAGRVSGRVVAAGSRVPIARALVWPIADPGRFAFTDDQGRYRLPGLATGDWVEVRAVDRVPNRQRPSEDALAAGNLAPFELERAARVTGRAVDAAGRGLPAVWVRALGRSGGVPASGALSAADGTYELRSLAPAEPYGLIAQKAGFLPAETKTVTERPPRRNAEEKLVLKRARPAFGRVLQEDGRPVADAEVRITEALDADARSRPRQPQAPGKPETMSDPEGRFDVATMPAEAIDILVSRAGFASSELRGFRAPEGSGPVDLGSIVLKAGVRITGRVTDLHGHPVSGAAVYRVARLRPPAELADGLRAREPDVTSGSDGLFALADLTRGFPVHLLVVAPGYLPETVRGIEPPTPAPVVVRLEPGSRLAGRVVDEERRPVPEADIEVTWQPTVPGYEDLPAGAATIRYVTSDHEGRFELFDLPAGRLSLAVDADGFQVVEKVEFSLPLPDGEPLLVELARGATVAGRVLTTDDEPVRGAQVLLGTAAGVSDARGDYRVTGVEPGSQVVEVSHPHHPLLELETEIEEGENALELVLEGGQEVRGRIVDLEGEPVPGAEIRFGFQRRRDIRWYRERADAEGAFELAPVAPGTYRLQAGAEGYANTYLEGVVVEDEPIDDLIVTLQPGSVIRGRILGLEADELAQVQVRAELRLRDSRVVEMDAAGNYWLEDLEAGDWLIEATLVEGRRQAQARVALAAGQEVERDLEFEERLALSGQVLYRDEPLADTLVSLRGRTWAVERHVTTDHEGSFLFEDLERDTYQLGLTNRRQLVVHNQWVEISADRDVTIRIERSNVAGTVIDELDGSPLAGARVTLRNATTSVAPEFLISGSTDEVGVFELAQVPPGRYRLAVVREGYASTSSELDVPAGQDLSGLELPLEPSPGAELIVRLASGAVPDFLHARVLSTAGGAVVSDTVFIEPDGRVRLSTVPPGSWTLLAAAPGGALVQQPLTVPGPPLELVLPDAARVAVRVGALGSSDLAASLRLKGSAGGSLRMLAPGGTVEDDWRMIGGGAVVDGVPAGTWLVEVIAPDGRQWTGTATTDGLRDTAVVLE